MISAIYRVALLVGISLGKRREQFKGFFQVILVEIDIPVVHFKTVMPGRRHDRAAWYAGHRPMRYGGVSQIVQVKILDASLLARQLKRPSDRIDSLTVVNENARA